MFLPDLAISDGTVNPPPFPDIFIGKTEEHFYSLTFLPLGIRQQLDGTLLYIRRDSRTTQTPIILTLVPMNLSSFFPRMIYLPQSPEIRTGVRSLIRLHIHWILVKYWGHIMVRWSLTKFTQAHRYNVQRTGWFRNMEPLGDNECDNKIWSPMYISVGVKYHPVSRLEINIPQCFSTH